MGILTPFTILGYTSAYPVNDTVYDSITPSTQTVHLGTGYYEVLVVGGGGGSSNPDGASGAGFLGEVFILEGDYTITVGKGGKGCAAYARNNNGETGGESSIIGNGMSIRCGAGGGARGRRNGGGVLQIGVVSYTLPYQHDIERAENGASNSKSFWDGTTTGAGAGGTAVCDECSGNPGKPGWVRLIFKH